LGFPRAAVASFPPAASLSAAAFMIALLSVNCLQKMTIASARPAGKEKGGKAMTGPSRDERENGPNELSPEKIDEIRSSLRLRKGGLAVNQHILFKHAAALPPAKRTGVLIAGWGPIALFPFVPILYFFDWKLSLFAIFFGIFWVGMGRKYAQAAILKQCHEDSSFLKFALTVGLVKLV
jgi:hypothetical protein